MMETCTNNNGNGVIEDQVEVLSKVIDEITKGIIDMQEGLSYPKPVQCKNENSSVNDLTEKTLPELLGNLTVRLKSANENLKINRDIIRKYLGGLKLE